MKLSMVQNKCRAQPDITSGPEVRQIVKIRTVRKPDNFLPGRRTVKDKKKNPQKKLKIFLLIFFFQFFCLSICLNVCRPVRQDLSGKFGCPVRSGRETRIPSSVEP